MTWRTSASALRGASCALSLATLLACSREPARVPTTPADVAGRVTAMDRAGETIGSIRVEAVPESASGSAKAVVQIGHGTKVIGPGARRSDFNDLAVGQWVRVWYGGPVMESYPVRATASVVVVDSAAR